MMMREEGNIIGKPAIYVAANPTSHTSPRVSHPNSLADFLSPNASHDIMIPPNENSYKSYKRHGLSIVVHT